MEVSQMVEISQNQKAELAKAGEINLENREISAFSQIDIPDITNKINLTNNFIADFTGFRPDLRLDTLILDNNPIVTFRNFPEIHQIRHFSAINAPITLLPNYRWLVLLALGNSLETIDGTMIQPAERAAVSGEKLCELFSRKVNFTISQSEAEQTRNRLANSLRKGWISNTYPKSIEFAEKEADSAENDPITVLAVRLFNLVHADEVTMTQFLRHHMAPTHKIVIEPPKIDDKLEQQQNLINFMRDQLVELKKEHQNQMKKLQKVTTHKTKAQKQEELKDLSEGTLNAYNELLLRAAPQLIENSQMMFEEEKKIEKKDPRGLRKVVAKLLGVDSTIGDRELAKMLREFS